MITDAPADMTANDAAEQPTRERIRKVAEDLYVLRGHAGFSFGHIAETIATTRANIHHHYGNKRRLMAELIEGFAGNAEHRIETIWARGEASFDERFVRQLEDLRRFYDRFNARPGDRNVWSPLSRLRLDLPVLGELAIKALERANRIYDRSLQKALRDAVGSGELPTTTPTEDLARLLRFTFLSCPPMTQDSGSFAEIERLFAALRRTIAALGGRAA